MPRLGIVLEPVENHPAVIVRQSDVERDRGGLDLTRENNSLRGRARDDGLEFFFARKFHHHVRKIPVVFDDQQRQVAGLQIRAVVRHSVRSGFVRQDDRNFFARRSGSHRFWHNDSRFLPPFQKTLNMLFRNAGWQIERERAALSRHALDIQRAAQQPRNFPADGKSQARAAKFSRRSSISLLKCFKNDLLFFLWECRCPYPSRQKQSLCLPDSGFRIANPSRRSQRLFSMRPNLFP